MKNNIILAFMVAIFAIFIVAIPAVATAASPMAAARVPLPTSLIASIPPKPIATPIVTGTVPIASIPPKPIANPIVSGTICIATQKIYVGQDATCGKFPNFRIELVSLGQQNSQGASPAVLEIYLNNVVTNTTTLYPNQSEVFVVANHQFSLKIDQTVDGLYADQKSATITVYNAHIIYKNKEAVPISTSSPISASKVSTTATNIAATPLYKTS